MPKIYFSLNAEKDFAKLPRSEKKKVIRKIKALKKTPFLGKLLGGKLKGLRSLRTWPYRIIYELDRSRNIGILHILHRQRAYK